MKRTIHSAVATAILVMAAQANAGIVNNSDITDVPNAVVPIFLNPYVGVFNTTAGGNSSIATEGFSGTFGQFPGGENPSLAFDNSTSGGSKYLNFGGENTGVIVNFAFPARITGMRFRYANDAPERDPDGFTLEGGNGPITDFTANPDLSFIDGSTTNQEIFDALEQGDGDANYWTLVASGATNLVDVNDTFNDANQARNQFQDELPFQRPGPTFSNPNFYTSYRLLFPTHRNSPFGNTIMQIAEIELIGQIDIPGIPEPSAILLALFGGSALAFVRRR